MTTETYTDQRAHDVAWMTAAEREAYGQRLEIVAAGHNCWQAVAGGYGFALLRWSGEHMVASLADGAELGTLYRSNGRIIGGETIYTWRAYRPGPFGAEVARGTSQADAVAALIEGMVTS